MAENEKPKPKIVETPIGDEEDPLIEDVLRNYGKADAREDFRLLGPRTGVGFDKSVLNLLCLAISLQLIGARTRAVTLTRLVLTTLALITFGMPNIFSSVGVSAWVLLVASSSYRPIDVLMNMWVIIQTGSSAVILLGFMIRKKLSIVLGTSHMIALMSVQLLFWAVERHQKAAFMLLETLAAAVLIGAYSGMVSSLPPEVLVFCLVVGWKTTLALILVASLTYIMPALYKYVMRLWQPKSGYRDYGGSLWFWTVSLANAGAIWAAERANHPTVAAVLALGMIVMFLYMDQTNVHMSLEFISKGETPEGVALENDEGRQHGTIPLSTWNE